MTEEQLQENVVHLMRAYGRPGVMWCAIANGEQRKRSTGAKLKRAGVIAGAPDLIFLIDGRFHGVELKTETGVLSIHQKNFGNWIETAGGNYFVCYGINQAFECLKAIGALPNHVRLTFPVLASTTRHNRK